jgi:hypothetical protein
LSDDRLERRQLVVTVLIQQPILGWQPLLAGQFNRLLADRITSSPGFTAASAAAILALVMSSDPSRLWDNAAACGAGGLRAGHW